MFIRQIGNLPSARCAHQKAFLYQKWFVNLLNGAFILAHGRSNGFQADRATFKFINNGAQNFIVHFIQAVFIHIQCIKGIFRYHCIDVAVAFYLRKIPLVRRSSNAFAIRGVPRLRRAIS